MGCGPEQIQAAGFVGEEGAGSKGGKNDSADGEIQMCEICVFFFTLQLYLSTRQKRGAYFSGRSEEVGIWLIWVGGRGFFKTAAFV